MSNPREEPRTIGPAQRFGYVLAIGAGAGLVPIAPGTVGALEGVGLFCGVVALSNSSLNLSPAGLVFVLIVSNALLFLIGVWSASCACLVTGIKDPSKTVIDEVSGQMIALTPLANNISLRGIIGGFVLFRLFDILKPYPIRRLEDLRGGLGVMADDALAGIYAGILLWVGCKIGLIY